MPGLYTIRVVADNNDGLARTPKVQAAFTVASDSNDISSNKNEAPDMLGMIDAPLFLTYEEY